MALGNDPADTREYCECDGQDPDCPECGGRGWLTETEAEAAEARRASYAADTETERKRQADDTRYAALHILLSRARDTEGMSANAQVRIFVEPGAEPIIEAEVTFELSPAASVKLGALVELSPHGFLRAFEMPRVIQYMRRRYLVVDVEVEDLERLHKFRDAYGDLTGKVWVSLHADYTTTPEDYQRAWHIYQDISSKFEREG